MINDDVLKLFNKDMLKSPADYEAYQTALAARVNKEQGETK